MPLTSISAVAADDCAGASVFVEGVWVEFISVTLGTHHCRTLALVLQDEHVVCF